MSQSTFKKSNKLFMLATCSTGFLLAANTAFAHNHEHSHAQHQIQNHAKQPIGLKVGINAMYADHGFKSYDNDIRILPSVFYDNKTVYARGNQLGLNVIKSKQHEVSVYAQYAGAQYDTDNVNDNALKQLDDKDSSVLVGGSYLYTSRFGGIRTQLATDALNKHGGSIAKASYVGRYKTDNLVVFPSIGLQWQDDKYNEYYYGVSEKEAAKTGIDNYKPDDSVHPYVSVMAMYDLTDDLGLFFNQNVAFHSDTQKESPKVEDNTVMATTLGLTYDF